MQDLQRTTRPAGHLRRAARFLADPPRLIAGDSMRGGPDGLGNRREIRARVQGKGPRVEADQRSPREGTSGRWAHGWLLRVQSAGVVRQSEGSWRHVYQMGEAESIESDATGGRMPGRAHNGKGGTSSSASARPVCRMPIARAGSPAPPRPCFRRSRSSNRSAAPMAGLPRRNENCLWIIVSPRSPDCNDDGPLPGAVIGDFGSKAHSGIFSPLGVAP